jgi:hypothetical protein
MAITADGWYTLTLEKFLLLDSNVVSFEAATLKYALGDNTATPNFDTDEFRNDATGVSEMTGTGYTAGGDPITSNTVTISPAATLMFDFADPQWTTLTTGVDAMCGMVCSGNATSSADELYLLHDFVTGVSTTAGTLDVTIAATGALTFT